jgi:hypothetical protein
MFVHIGNNNFVNAGRVIAVTVYNSVPMKRAFKRAIDNNMAVDCTAGRRTRSLIFMDSGHVIAASLTSSAIVARISDKERTDSQ